MKTYGYHFPNMKEVFYSLSGIKFVLPILKYFEA